MSKANWDDTEVLINSVRDRERRRIRRAQAKALKLIRWPNSGMTRDYYADIIESATRALRAKRRRGK